jgi:hypothetical protein
MKRCNAVLLTVDDNGTINTREHHVIDCEMMTIEQARVFVYDLNPA